MKIYMGFCLLVLSAAARAQSSSGAPHPSATVAQIKSDLEKTDNPILYTKQILKKRFRIDTIVVSRTHNFDGLADSLAYYGKEKKVYGPYGSPGNRFLVQVLSKAPNQFYHVGQIFIDTAVFRYRLADSLGTVIIDKIKKGTATFEQMAEAYSMGGEAATKGDLGWVARGVLQPTFEHEMLVHKKGEVFKVWSRRGLHIIRKIDEPKQDTGFTLMLQVFL